MIETLKEAAKVNRRRPFSWLWAEARAQPELEKGLEIGGFGYPAVAAINGRKTKFALMRGSFSKSSINDFIAQLVCSWG